MKIKYLGPGTANVMDLDWPEPLEVRAETERVRVMAETIEMVGQMQRTGVRKRDGKVAWGTDRGAAQFLRGNPDIPVEWIDCTDEELELMRGIENVQRRGPDADEEATLTDLVAKYKVAWSGKVSDPERAAIDAAARDRGVKPGTVERQMRRERKQPPGPPHQEAPATSLPDGFETWGCGVEDQFVSDIVAVMEHLAKAAHAAEQAQAAVTRALNTETIAVPARLKRIKDEMHDAAAAIRAQMPACICCYCKCVVEDCPACGGKSWSTVEQMRGAPPELLNLENLQVHKAGGLVTVASLMDGDEQEQQGELTESADEADPFGDFT